MAESNAEEVIRQCEEFIADPAHNVLIETFESRIESMEGLSEKEKEELQDGISVPYWNRSANL